MPPLSISFIIVSFIIVSFIIASLRMSCWGHGKLLAQTVYRSYSSMSAIMNFLWFILGGVFMGLAWWLAGLLCFLSIVGIPWGKACFVIGQFSFFPFGKEAVSRRDLHGRHDIGTGGFGTLGNIVWFIFAGIWLAIGHVVWAVGCFVTIIGIPFGIQHLKLAGIALAPIGMTVVDKDVASAARRREAEATVSRARSRD